MTLPKLRQDNLVPRSYYTTTEKCTRFLAGPRVPFVRVQVRHIFSLPVGQRTFRSKATAICMLVTFEEAEVASLPPGLQTNRQDLSRFSTCAINARHKTGTVCTLFSQRAVRQITQRSFKPISCRYYAVKYVHWNQRGSKKEN